MLSAKSSCVQRWRNLIFGLFCCPLESAGSGTVLHVIVCFFDVLHSNVIFGLLVRSTSGIFLPYESWFKSLLEKGLL